MAVTRQSFASSLLTNLNLPTTSTNIQIVVGWETAEGGAGPQFGVAANAASFNPLNTTMAMPGSVGTPGNSPPVQAFVSWEQGLQATVQTLAQSNFSSIRSMLQSGSASAATAAAVIDSSPWGTRGLTAAMITGASTSAGGDPINSQSLLPGASKVSASLWYVGDEMNPDEDYWTCINRYGQSAQWYVFSDGETLYVADGIQLMGQTPTDVIVLFDPRVVEAHLTYDNTAFNYTHNTVKKGKTVRKATLSRTTSPTECEVKIICPIDSYRGGDLVLLQGFGQAADGPWLVGEVRRSIFEPYSTLTLVQGMAPINAVTGTALGPAFASGGAATKAGAGTVINAMVSEAATINNEHLPYVWGGGHARTGVPSGAPTPGFDCSGAVAAVLSAGGIWTQSSVPTSDGIVSALLSKGGVIAPGFGSGQPECTLFDTPSHIFMRLNGEFFGTADGGGGIPQSSPGGGWIPNGSPGSGYRTTHVLPSVLGQQASGGG